MELNNFWHLENFNAQNLFCPNKLDSDMAGHKMGNYAKGDKIYIPKQDADKLYVIFSGRVKISTNSDEGKEVTKLILGEGEVFGELALAGEDKRRDQAQALDDCQICILTIQQAKSLMVEHSALSTFFLKLMGSRVIEMEQRLESLVFKDSRSRIVSFVEEMGLKKGERVGYETLVRRFLTHQQIANLTATSRQTVTTVLNDLKNKNVITFNRKRLLIRDMELLAKEK